MTALQSQAPAEDEALAVAGQVCDAQEKIEELGQACMFPMQLLFKKYGEPMLAAGKKKQIVGEFAFTCYPPKEREYCTCHDSLTHMCPTPAHERTVYLRKEAFPYFRVRRIPVEAAG
jgi:hypothetical protein